MKDLNSNRQDHEQPQETPRPPEPRETANQEGRRGIFRAVGMGAGVAAAAALAPTSRPSTAWANPPFVDRNNLAANVKEFGAVGDGVTDDQAAIQRAIDHVSATSAQGQTTGGGTVYFPAGMYVLGHSVTVSASGVGLVGEGQASCLLRAPTNHAPYLVGFVGGDTVREALRDISVRDLAIGEVYSRGFIPQDNDETGVLLRSAVEFNITRAFIRQHHGTALKLSDAFTGIISDCSIAKGMDGIALGGVSNAVHIRGSRIYSNRGSGIRFPASDTTGPLGLSPRARGTSITDCTIEGNRGNGILFTDATCMGIQISGCFFEHNLLSEPGSPWEDPRPHASDEAGHVHKTPDPTPFQGVAITGNHFGKVGSTNLAVAIDHGDSGLMMGNNFLLFADLTPDHAYRVGTDAKGWVVTGGDSVHGVEDPLTVLGDLAIPEAGGAVRMTSPNGTQFHISVADDGTLVANPA